MSAWSRPKVGVSACLLGFPVRFDGGHKHSDFLERLARFVDLVPVCPEVEAGLPVPRESLRLVTTSTGPRLVGNRTGADFSDRMRAFAAHRVEALASVELDGFILQKNSPSCGLERVRLYRAPDQPPAREGTGLFAAALRARFPALPLVEEGWLHDAARRASFLERIFFHRRMRRELWTEPSSAKLVAFHTEHKLLYLSHSPARYRRLGRVVASLGERPLAATLEEYLGEAMSALTEPSTPGKHANVLEHMMGFFKRELSDWEKRELLDLVEEFREGVHGLSVPLALFGHYLRRHDSRGWLARQAYLQPFPRELGSR